jgi:DNA topoisomerase-1
MALADPFQAARHAGLRHVDDRRPGLRRRAVGTLRRARPGRPPVPKFVIQDARGRVVRDPATLERIQKLAIPPAWRDVWICPDANGHLQVTGRDARGRKQYRYHPRWRDERDSTKYARLADFGRALPALRRRIAADLRLPGLPRRKVLALVVRLLETSFIRVGNEEYARENGSFGLTTMQDRHVDVHASTVEFHFRGKSGVQHRVALHDARVARIVRSCRDLPGHELFQYVNERGQPTSVDSADVNAYLHEVTGREFTAKDFRTWAGTILAARALKATADAARTTSQPRPSSRRARVPRPTHKDVVRAIHEVAGHLGNTPAVCRKCYIHPYVIAAYQDGTLATTMARVNGGAHPRATEVAVLTLLRQRAGEERRGTTLLRQLRSSLRAA